MEGRKWKEGDVGGNIREELRGDSGGGEKKLSGGK
jgi:hypothetical protein